MARMHQSIVLALIGFTLTGCVAQEKYNALKLDRDEQAARLARADAEAQAARAESEAYRKNYDAVSGNTNNQGALVSNLTQQQLELQKSYDELNRRYEEAMRNAGRMTVLPVEVSDALNKFAQQNPDLVDFDSSRGVVKFKSDVTFSAGSSDIQPRAREAIDRFAQILNSDAARGFELQVAGHTDSSPVANPETLRHGHKDNWYLSVHRAISVSNELQAQRVSPTRIQVAGSAEQHPVASNATEQGKAQNRRVEVLILPSSARAVANTGGSTPAYTPKAPVRPNFNKDTAEIDRRPVYNK